MLFVRRIRIGSRVFLGAGTRIGPGVRVGDDTFVPILSDIYISKRMEAAP